MKILAIRIKNLASLEGNTEIDFTAEPLYSAGIFAITGATGAGKSTILDALCLALYGKTPRYLQAKEAGIEIRDVQGATLSQGDIRSILRDGTAEGFAEVDFAGNDGQHYRANWSVRRARNRAEGSMQSDAVTLKNITTHVAFPGKKQETLQEIARLVGLNFEQFTRSVLLAQGDFTAFMKANKDEKSSLLEKLTGTHIYSEISKKIYEHYKQEDQQLRELHLKKEGIVTLSEEELKILSDDQNLLETQVKILEEEIGNLTNEINWHNQLVTLQTGYNEAYKTLQLAAEATAIALPQKQKLQEVEQVQQTRSWTDALKHIQQQHAEKAAILVKLEETISNQQKEKESLETALGQAENDLAEKNKLFTDALPLLEQAKKLDTLLEEKKKQVEKYKQEAENASELNQKHQILLTARQKEYHELIVQIKSVTNWERENRDRSQIAENKDIILSKLQDAQKLLKTLQTVASEQHQLLDKIKTEETQITQVQAAWKKQLQDLESLKKDYDAQSRELLLTPIETLHLQKTETDLQVEKAIRAQACWQLFYSALTELENLNQKYLQVKTDYTLKYKTLQQLTLQLPVKKAQKDTSYQLLQQARMASAENVGTLRATLVDNEPCPVCGSTVHPYSEHNLQLEKVLKQLEASYEEKEKNYLASDREYTILKQECHMLQETIQHQSEEIDQRQIALQDKKNTWERFDIAKESQAVTGTKKAGWIEEKLEFLRQKKGNLQVQVQAHSDKKMQLEADKTKIDQLKETTDYLADQIKDRGNNLSVYREQQNSKTKELTKAAADLAETERLLSPFFAAPDWTANWKTNPVSFIDHIHQFARKWKENTEKTAQFTREKAVLEATLEALDKQAENLSSEAARKTEIYKMQYENLLDLIQQRNTLFEGQPTEETETRIKHALTEAQQQLEHIKEKRQQLSIDYTKAHAQKEEFIAILTALEADAHSISQKIQNWLNHYNQQHNQTLDIVKLNELLALNSDWIATERDRLLAVEKEETKAHSVLAERKQALDAHQHHGRSERPLEELTSSLGHAKSAVEQKKHKKGENSFRLQQDELHKKKIGNLLNDIAAQSIITENWGKLNDIIGSADGKKFRQIAQEYTLDVLLGYANIHLQSLTSRYKIERIPASLGLQVVDQDMGNEVRTVYSLSGGESFLVSLALALGLASLSSSRMKVESLFIDEGFGSLDPATLNIAMDALERLHNQGRKVGIISHVQEMTERIPVQIKVSKQQNGKSKVEVIGNY